MNRSEWLTDDLIQAAFEQRASRAAPGDLRDLVIARTGVALQRAAWRFQARHLLSAPAMGPAWVAMFVLAALLGLAVAAATVGQHQAPQPVPTQFRAGPFPSSLLSASPSPSEATPVPRPMDDVAALPTGGTPLPDIAGARPGDDGRGPLPLGTIIDAPNPDRLDFLFEFCWPKCFRDAHWMDPQNSKLGSGVWTAGRPFHVREGFINNGAEPLGDGFDVVLYVTRMNGSREATYRYTSDYVVRGTSERCGPTYETQTGPATCEWFVHDFPKGLPEGRFAIWAAWEAPCKAWIDLALTDACEDPDKVISLFSSGFDAPFTESGPSFTEVEGPFTDPAGAAAPSEATPVPRPMDDVAALPTGGTPLPDIAGARPGDDGRGPLPLGTIIDAPNPDRLDFLFEFCWPKCFRDAHWMDPRTRSWARASGRLAARSTSAKGSSTTGRSRSGTASMSSCTSRA